MAVTGTSVPWDLCQRSQPRIFRRVLQVPDLQGGLAAESKSVPCLVSFLALGLAENFPLVPAAYAAVAS